MKTSLKWIFGIVIAMVVISAIVALGFLVFGRLGGGAWVMGPRTMHPWDGGRAMPMHPEWGFPQQRFIAFSPLRLIGGGLFFLSVLVLLVAGVVVLVRALNRGQQAPVSAAPTVVEQKPTRSCPNCQSPVQEDWSHCPYCGVEQSQT